MDDVTLRAFSAVEKSSIELVQTDAPMLGCKDMVGLRTLKIVCSTSMRMGRTQSYQFAITIWTARMFSGTGMINELLIYLCRTELY